MSKMIKCLVCDDNDIMRQMILDMLSDAPDIEVIGEACDGREAVDAIKELVPDVVLLDLVMPNVDGINVLKIVDGDTTLERKPEFIVVSAVGKESIVSEALNRGASYFIMKPFDGAAIIDRIRAVCDSEENAAATLENDIVELLKNIGVPIKMVGYKYLRDAISISTNSADAIMSITKSIYPEIASNYGTSSGNVERNIRYVIEATWLKAPESKYEKLFFEIFNRNRKKPTNTEFILSCSEYIGSRRNK